MSKYFLILMVLIFNSVNAYSKVNSINTCDELFSSIKEFPPINPHLLDPKQIAKVNGSKTETQEKLQNSYLNQNIQVTEKQLKFTDVGRELINQILEKIKKMAEDKIHSLEEKVQATKHEISLSTSSTEKMEKELEEIVENNLPFNTINSPIKITIDLATQLIFKMDNIDDISRSLAHIKTLIDTNLNSIHKIEKKIFMFPNIKKNKLKKLKDELKDLQIIRDGLEASKSRDLKYLRTIFKNSRWWFFEFKESDLTALENTSLTVTNLSFLKDKNASYFIEEHGITQYIQNSYSSKDERILIYNWGSPMDTIEKKQPLFHSGNTYIQFSNFIRSRIYSAEQKRNALYNDLNSQRQAMSQKVLTLSRLEDTIESRTSLDIQLIDYINNFFELTQNVNALDNKTDIVDLVYFLYNKLNQTNTSDLEILSLLYRNNLINNILSLYNLDPTSQDSSGIQSSFAVKFNSLDLTSHLNYTEVKAFNQEIKELRELFINIKDNNNKSKTKELSNSELKFNKLILESRINLMKDYSPSQFPIALLKRNNPFYNNKTLATIYIMYRITNPYDVIP